ncbi:MAG: moderate conductance mechanosensitive channel, partial [Acidobacteriaceae bacterium]|nr:moderate conductance mechanosensitive channel [Acidobacteriaceae bacterium]
MPVYATIFSFASLLGWFDPTSTFLRGLNQEWLADVQSFLHTALPKLLFIGLTVRVLILVVNFLTGRVIKIAEHRDKLGTASGAQVRTLATVVRATGIGVVGFLAFLQIMENVLHFNLGP